MFFCLFCAPKKIQTELVQRYLCGTCFHKLPRLNPKTQSRGISLFAYQGPIQDLIRKTKITGSLPHQLVMKDLLIGSLPSLDVLNGAQGIVPAPSSLWGRVRGRFDIAEFMAQILSKVSGVPLIYPPRSLYWRWKKQTQLQQRQRVSHPLQKQWISPPDTDFYGRSHLLFVDDVMTSGYTFFHTTAQWPDTDFRYITFARAAISQRNVDSYDPNDETVLRPESPMP